MIRPLSLPRNIYGRAALLSLFLLAVPALLGRTPIELSLNHGDGRYGPNETAIISVTIAPEVLEAHPWHGTVSWQRNWSGEPLSRPWIATDPEIHFPLDDEKPGQIVVTVTLQAGDDPSVTHRSTIGFLCLPEAIELSTKEPRDFDEFWNEQKKRWRGLRQEVVLRPVDSPSEGVSCWDLTINLEGETPVSGYLALPGDPAAKSLPAILYVHGAGVRSASLVTAANAARLGFAALDINAHGLPNGMANEFYQEKNSGELSGYRQQGADSRETWYFRTMYLRVVTALDYLCSLPEWNGHDLVLHGSSQGGGQALAGAGLDSRVTVVAASVPALCDLTGKTSERKPGWPQPGEAAGLEASRRTRILETVPYFDGGIFARRIEAPVILSLGLVDSVCPAVGVQATLNNLAGPALVLYRPTMGHAFPTDIKKAFDKFILERVALPSAR